VYEDGAGALDALLKKTSSTHGSLSKDETDHGARLVFHTQPSPVSTDGRFHILVADDVLMIRKGTVNNISNLWSTGFFSCPVVVSTACTAEDVLRAASSQHFDLIICDHHFQHEACKLQSICPEDPTRANRPFVLFDDSVTLLEDRHKSASAFFKDERFTIEEGDGTLLGLDVLMKLAQDPNPPFPTPVLMLVSGNKIDEQPDLGIIVAQKPLKQSDFVNHFKSIQRFLKRDPP
jgi:CheY-like chemotaxis protein